MICALALAGGRSRRMGTQKVLLPYGRKTIISHIVDQLAASEVDEIYVVVGHDGQRVTEELSGRDVRIVVNRNCEAQMLSSIRCGLKALPRNCEAALVALGDQPRISTAVVNELLQAFEAGRGTIVVPAYEGSRGHPIVFSMRYRDAVIERYDDTGLRGLLREYCGDVYKVAVRDSAVLSDMDYPEDYQRELLR